MYHMNTLYTLNLHNVICQLYLNKAGGRKKNKQTKNTKPNQLISCFVTLSQTISPVEFSPSIYRMNYYVL